jgi:viologen exporter family transport system permease protein
MNIALTPYEFEERVLRGTLSPLLLRPLHLFHLDLAGFFSFKAVTFFLWIPIGIGLSLAFHPALNPTWWQVAAFAVAIVTGFIMRFTLVWALGLATFWITKVSALFEVYFGIELFFSGRLVPIALLPVWMQQGARWLPFQWSFGFPIELLLGKLTVEQTLIGFGAQLIWFLIGAGLVALLWRAGLKRYGAVGA